MAVRYPHAVPVRHPWELTPALGTSVTQQAAYVRRVVQLPRYFGGHMGNGVAIAASGVLNYYDNVDGRIARPGVMFLCHRDPRRAPLVNLATDFTPVEASEVGATWTPFGGHSGMDVQIWAQRNGRFAYLMYSRAGNQFGGASDMNIMRLWGPNPGQQKWLSIPNRLASGAPTGPSASPTWYAGSATSAFVTDHDRSPMIFLQDADRTMAFLDNPDWLVNFGLRNWYSTFSSPTPSVHEGFSWAFYQDHTHPSGTVGCRIMPPVNKFKAPTLWWFVVHNAIPKPGMPGDYLCELDVYRAKWLPDQWRPDTTTPYGATHAVANANRGKPYDVSQVDYIRQVVNPRRMGFERVWDDDAHRVTRIRGLSYRSTATSIVPHVDRASDGTPVVMLCGASSRVTSGQGLVYSITEGAARLRGVVPLAPALSSASVLYGIGGSNAALVNDIPLFAAGQYLTSTGLPVGQGSISGRGEIYRRGELNRHSWLV